MARTGIFHHVGTFLLFAAAILLLITTISSPLINDIGILKVVLTNQSEIRNSSVTFGTFGYCVLDAAPGGSDQDWCTGRHIGYNPADVMANIDNTDYSTAATDTSKGLTRVMILHPICCGLAFIAFLLALGSGLVGALLASVVSFLTWALTLVVMATDFTLFGIVKNHVNRDGSGSHAYFSTGMWTILAAMICLFFATFIVLFTCFSARKHKRQERAVRKEEAALAPKRKFWQRRAKY